MEWPQEWGEEFKSLAFMHTAYISELLDGNLLRSTAAGMWHMIRILAEFPLPLCFSGTLYSHTQMETECPT